MLVNGHRSTHRGRHHFIDDKLTMPSALLKHNPAMICSVTLPKRTIKLGRIFFQTALHMASTVVAADGGCRPPSAPYRWQSCSVLASHVSTWPHVQAHAHTSTTGTKVRYLEDFLSRAELRLRSARPRQIGRSEPERDEHPTNPGAGRVHQRPGDLSNSHRAPAAGRFRALVPKNGQK
jgi:hypothetical protein